jgi:phosphoglycerate dehydrogenase-like enzyme
MKIGILGLGSIGSRHAKNLKAMGHEVLGYDPARGTHSRDAVLEADAIIIASPTTKHCNDLLDCYQTPHWLKSRSYQTKPNSGHYLNLIYRT